MYSPSKGNFSCGLRYSNIVKEFEKAKRYETHTSKIREPSFEFCSAVSYRGQVRSIFIAQLNE